MTTTPTFGRYRPLTRIGHGGMAEVFCGYADGAGLEQLVALKYLRAEVRDDPAHRLRFFREAEIGLALHHPNIVATRMLDEDDGVPVLVLEFVGPPVSAATAVISGDPDPLRWLAEESLHALGYLADEGVVHRDVSPGNLLINPRGRILLGDFGVATRFDGSKTPGLVGGTWPYTSPELARGERSTVASDLFSLGAVLYELACGNAPFGTDPKAVRRGHNRGAPRLPRRFPRDLRTLIMELLAIDPAQRPRAVDARALLRPVDPAVAERLGLFVRQWLRVHCPGITHPMEGVATYAKVAAPPRNAAARRRWRRAVIPASGVLTAAGAAFGFGMWMSANPGERAVTPPRVESVSDTASEDRPSPPMDEQESSLATSPTQDDAPAPIADDADDADGANDADTAKTRSKAATRTRQVAAVTAALQEHGDGAQTHNLPTGTLWVFPPTWRGSRLDIPFVIYGDYQPVEAEAIILSAGGWAINVELSGDRHGGVLRVGNQHLQPGHRIAITLREKGVGRPATFPVIVPPRP